jgi:hypothetical protein
MPSPTDRSDLATARPGPASAPRPVWPVTAGIVLVGVLLLGWEVVAAAVGTAPFFAETPSRDRYIEAGMLLTTSVVPVALLCLLGWLLGSRWGLALLALPGAVAVAMGVDLMGRTGGENYPDRTRPVELADVAQDLVRPNWLATGVLAVAVALQLWRRRRQSGQRADP